MTANRVASHRFWKSPWTGTPSWPVEERKHPALAMQQRASCNQGMQEMIHFQAHKQHLLDTMHSEVSWKGEVPGLLISHSPQRTWWALEPPILTPQVVSYPFQCLESGKTALFTGLILLVQDLASLQETSPWSALIEHQEFFSFLAPPRCSQSAVLVEMTSDLISNGMETVKPKFSEDCLYLNIYTPADLMKRSRLPVSSGNHWSRLV